MHSVGRSLATAQRGCSSRAVGWIAGSIAGCPRSSGLAPAARPVQQHSGKEEQIHYCGVYCYSPFLQLVLTSTRPDLCLALCFLLCVPAVTTYFHERARDLASFCSHERARGLALRPLIAARPMQACLLATCYFLTGRRKVGLIYASSCSCT